MRFGAVCLFVCLCLGGLYFALKRPVEVDTTRKIEFDLDQLDADGLRGPPDGKTALSYEFGIPNQEECKTQVSDIDQTVQFMPGSRGRTVRGENQCLCIGSTHQKSYREVLLTLARLPFIERIIICDFE